MAPGIFSSYTKSCGVRPQLFRCLSSISSVRQSVSGVFARLHFRFCPRHHLAHHDVPGLLIVVGAGAQGHQPVVLRYVHRIPGDGQLRPLPSSVDIGLLLRLAVRHLIGVLVRCLRDKSREHHQMIVSVRRRKLQGFVLVVIAVFLCISPNASEHAAILHVMTIYNGIKALKILLHPAVHEQGAAAAPLLVEARMEVGVVVRSLNHRIVDHGALLVQPALHIRIHLLQRLPIHHPGELLRIHLCGLLTDIRIRGLCHLVFPHGLSDLISAHQNNSNQANGNHVERPVSNPHRQGRIPKRFFPPHLRFPLRRPLLLTSRTCSVRRIFIFTRVHTPSF